MSKIDSLVLMNIPNNNNYFITRTGEVWRKYNITWNGKKIQKTIDGKPKQIKIEDSEEIFKKINCLLDLKNNCYYKKIKCGKNKTGHMSTILTIDGKKKNISVHRMVAEHFIKNPNGYPFVNHIDCNPQNNNVRNLEWCTQKYNVEHAIKNARMDWEHKKVAILQYDHDGNFIQRFNSAVEAEQKTGALRSVICRALNKNKLAKGYLWRIENGEILKKINGIKKPKFWKRGVLMYDLEGNFIEEFNSISEITKKYGINNVRAVLRGNRKQAGGYTFKYKNEM